MTKQILCTLGPASLNDRVVSRLEELGATLFRINLSHTRFDDLEPVIDYLQARTRVPICLDTEGAQVRTGQIVSGAVDVADNSVLRVHARRIPGDAGNINLYPAAILAQLEIGDFVSIDFDSVLTQVTAKDDGVLTMRVLNGGRIGSNKAVTVQRPLSMAPLTDKDIAAVELGVRKGIRHVALSFAHRAADVEQLRRLAMADSFIISKIECRSGLADLDAIARASDALLIDRGDLSREFPIEQIPGIQRRILADARRAGVPVYVATNLLESMVTASTPTRAEVNDIYHTLADGADGLVLAAETAIGAYPVQSASMVVRMIREFEQAPGDPGGASALDPISFLVEPHGGRLVQRAHDTGPAPQVDGLPTLAIRPTDLMDCEQFALGTYSPLDGFMDRETLYAVLDDCRLPSGATWTLPLILQTDRKHVRGFGVGDRITLTGADGAVYALLDVAEIYPLDLEDVARRWFGSADPSHPGVARVAAAGEIAIGGAVTLVRRTPSEFRHYELSPMQTRFIFAHKGWGKVVGFHTRNAVHRVHEFIQLQALEKTGADGLYISPVIGPKKKNDFLPGPIMKSYQAMLEFGLYPRGKVVLGSFSTYSRYAGPREAVFTALCRKNMGCSHFIIGRDHTGVGDFYGPDDNRRLFERLGDIGIEPVFFDAIGYDPAIRAYRNGADPSLQHISGTQVRETLRAGGKLPDWFMRDVVQEVLRDEIAGGRPVFYDA